MILLDIGNTHTRIARNEGETVRILRTIPTAELTAEMLPDDGPIAAASVCPSAAERLSSRNVNFIDAGNCRGLVDFSSYTGMLGADRVANAVAAAEYYPLPALVIDCGSAITWEMVNAERKFAGGAIAPGRRLMRAALCRGTAQLPEVEMASSLPDGWGFDTAESIRWGVDAGALGMVRELTVRLGSAAGLRSIILTGGDAGFFAAEFPNWRLAPADFTLQGVRLAAGG